ncbi:MAG: acyl phosphate:glycerol-3-phosphate acyltransferase [Thermotogaceae bacterium]|nr:acyl phosphate:glycerol-3-phosphate acyltransferase [Thermotogaceae bacterium]
MIIQFLSGSVMYSHIIARMLKIDLTKVRDGNPGSTNLWRAAGWKFGLPALLLDYFKGVFPLIIFIWTGQISNGFFVSLIALSGVLGHAFSPMLKFKGGKGVATTFGAWTVLTGWEAPTILGSFLTIFSLLKPKSSPREDSVKYILGLFILAIYVTIKSFIIKDWYLVIFYIGSLLIAFYKNKKELVGDI